MKYLHIFVISALLTTVYGFSQNSKLLFNHISVDDGLSQSWVLCIEQDKQGLIWFGTSDGLNCYNGYDFEIYTHNPKISTSVINNYITSLENDTYGRLWVGTRVGLCLYDKEKNNFSNDKSWPKDAVHCILAIGDRLYIGTYFGLFVYNLKTLEPESEMNTKIAGQFTNIRVNCISLGSDNRLWVGTSKGLYLYNIQSQFIEVIEDNTLFKDLAVRSIEIDYLNRIWVGTENDGLFLIEKKNNNEFDFSNFRYNKNVPNSINNGNISALKAVNNNYLWIGIENGGLNRIDIKNLTKTSPEFEKYVFEASSTNNLSSNSIYSIFVDKHENMWIGTYGGGINLVNLQMQNFTTFRHAPLDKNSLVNNMVNCIVRKNDNLFIGTEGGLSIYNLITRKFSNFQYSSVNDNTLGSNAVYAIYPQNENKIWVGTWNGGLCLLNSNTGNVHRFGSNNQDPNSLNSNNIFSILEDFDGDIWVATMGGGLSVINKETGIIKTYRQNNKTYDYDKNLLTDWIQHIYQNNEGELWLATIVGVDLFNKKTGIFIHYSSDINDSVSLSGSVYTVFQDSKGTMWFGTDVGIDYFNRKDSTFRSYNVNDGLPDNSIKSILEDDNGNLWMGTNDGVVKFKNGIFLPKKPEFKVYDLHDGLQGYVFNRRSAFKDLDGNLYFGGANGFNVFHPDSLKSNKIAPPVVLTNFSIMNEPVKISETNSPLTKHIDLTSSITLTHKQSIISIEYAGLNYFVSQKNQYAFILEGFEEKWNYVGTKRLATYTNLDPGKYTFKVKASNNDGIWNETPRELEIIILPPWWNTKFARFLYFIMLIMTVIYLIKSWQRRYKRLEQVKIEHFKREQEEKLHQQKVQFFMNVSHEFRTPLSLIYSPIEEILHNQQYQFPSALKRKLTIIYKNTLRLTRLIEELMVFRKLEHNKLELNILKQDICAFLNEIVAFFEEEAEMNKISLKVDMPKNNVFIYFDSKMMEKVFFNLISNAFKVTGENGKIGIKVIDTPDISEISDNNSPDEQWICVEISDNGPGLSKEQSEKIFELYYHIDNLSKTYYSSVGMGLTLTKSLIEKHSGKILISSEPDKGSIFKVYLRKGKEHFASADGVPIIKDVMQDIVISPVEFESEREVETSDSSKKSILIVEDNGQLRNYLKDELKTHFKIYLANDGMIGYELAIKQLPDIIVSDILMPLKNGLELCTEIKNNMVTSHIPVILLTAKGTIEDQIQGNISGADAYISKPFHIKLLKSKIYQLLKTREDLFRKYSKQLDIFPESKSYTTLDTNFLKNLKDYVIKNISDSQLSVENLGIQMNLSRSQLYRKVKSLTGISVNEFIRIIRLEQAKKLLETKKYQISEIGYNVGFTSPSYFSKCYRDYFGKLPSEESF